jgi:hypothetical protein
MAQSRTTPRLKIYFLRDNDEQKWCGYVRKDEWTARFEKTDTNVAGYVLYSGRDMVQINVRQTSVSGDWALDDKYTLGAHQTFVQLDRDLGYFSENERVKERYRFTNGCATLVSRSASNLATQKPLLAARSIDAYGTWPISTSTRDLAFQSLLAAATDIPRKGSFCVE